MSTVHKPSRLETRQKLVVTAVVGIKKLHVKSAQDKIETPAVHGILFVGAAIEPRVAVNRKAKIHDKESA